MLRSVVMPSDVPAISTTNLTKRYGAVTALAGIDLVVPGGVTYGFLGPNGAGKTTTIRLLMGFIRRPPVWHASGATTAGTTAFAPEPTSGSSCRPTRSIPT